MNRAAVVIHHHVEADTSRGYRTLGTAGEFHEAGDEVGDQLTTAGRTRLERHRGHASIKNLVDSGCQILDD